MKFLAPNTLIYSFYESTKTPFFTNVQNSILVIKCVLDRLIHFQNDERDITTPLTLWVVICMEKQIKLLIKMDESKEKMKKKQKEKLNG